MKKNYIRISKDVKAVYEIIDKINAGTYTIDIKYKRVYRVHFNPARIIEAAIYGLELPAIHLKYNMDGVSCIKNAKQIMVFAAYIDNKFDLRYGKYVGKKFDDLEPRIQRRIKEYHIQLRFLTDYDNDQLKYYLEYLDHFRFHHDNAIVGVDKYDDGYDKKY